MDSTDGTKQTILIVDDHPTNLGVLFEYLRQFGYRVLVAEDGVSALKRISFVKPDIILLDIMMPRMDGFETCRQLKEQDETRDIPVIFMTALTETVDKVRGFELGAVDYITKPLQAEEVLARLRAHLTIRTLQQELQDEIEAQQELIKELDAFARTVAHDLKSPIGAAMTYVDFMLEYFDELPPEQIRSSLERVSYNGQRMINIIDELLLLSSVRKADVVLIPLDMGAIVAQSVERLTLMIKDYQARIDVPAKWPEAEGYAPWVEEVWVNYISNAMKYGGEPPEIKLGADQDGDKFIRFWVQDNGEGLTEAQQQSLFTEFTRLAEQRVEGHGLGLSIVRRIVERLGGRVGVESTPSRGSTFYFTLPVAEDLFGFDDLLGDLPDNFDFESWQNQLNNPSSD